MSGAVGAGAAQRYQEYLASAAGRERTEAAWSWLGARVGARRGIAVDVGGGSGEIAVRLARAGWSVVVLDRSEEMLRLAGEAVAREPARSRERILLVRGDVAQPPLAASSADLVVCHHAVAYVGDWRGALERIAGLVAPGGLVSVASLIAGVAGDGEPDRVFGLHRRGIGGEELRDRLVGLGAARVDQRRAARYQQVVATWATGAA